MKLKTLPYAFTVCKLADGAAFNPDREFTFFSRTDEERSLVCRTQDVPANTTDREDGWRCFRIEGVLDFSLIGILAKRTGILAENRIGVFAVSTFNTDYLFVKAEQFDRALRLLAAAGDTLAEG